MAEDSPLLTSFCFFSESVLYELIFGGKPEVFLCFVNSCCFMCSLLHIWRIAIVSSSDQNTLHSQALLASSDGLCLFFQAALCCVWQVKRSEMVRQRVRST